MLLAVVAIVLQGPLLLRQGVQARDLLLGIVSALALWVVFWAGGHLADAVLPFAAVGVDEVYDFKSDQSLVLVAALHALVISPAEEVYWRGLVQSTFQGRWGVWRGWLAGTAAYAGVHLLTGNLMLVIAAAVAGGAWGALYAWQGRLSAGGGLPRGVGRTGVPGTPLGGLSVAGAKEMSMADRHPVVES